MARGLGFDIPDGAEDAFWINELHRARGYWHGLVG